MANTLTVLVPKIIANVQKVLRQEFLLAKMVNKDFDGSSAKKGNAVDMPIAAAQSTYSVTPAATPPALVDKTPTSKSISLSNWKGTRFHLSSKEFREIMAGKFVQGQLAESVRAILYDINANILANYIDIYGYVGTAGTNPFASNTNICADAHGTLNDQLCPKGNRKLVMGTAEETAGKKLSDFKDASIRGNSGVLATGEIGPAFGFTGIGSDSQRPVHTTGAAASYQINNGAGYVAGDTSLVIDTGTGAWVEGDIVTFAGHSQTYAVDTGSTTTLLKLKNPLVAAVADDEAITKKATHKANLAFDPEAFGVVMRLPAEDFAEEMMGQTEGVHIPIVDPETGCPLLLSQYPGYHALQWELSALWGSKLLVPARACRIAG